jgi:hypothetical protein
LDEWIRSWRGSSERPFVGGKRVAVLYNHNILTLGFCLTSDGLAVLLGDILLSPHVIQGMEKSELRILCIGSLCDARCALEIHPMYARLADGHVVLLNARCL